MPRLTHLELDLSINYISDKVLIEHLSHAFDNFNQLVSLKLSFRDNGIASEGVKILSYGISQLYQLTYLSLNLISNGIKNEGAHFLFE